MNENEIFTLYAPSTEPIGLLSIPHSGEVIPELFHDYLTDDLRALAEDLDYKVHELVDIDQLVEAGVIVLVSHIHRTCIDLNRSEDLAVIAWPNNSKGVQLQTKELTDELKEELLAKYHRPYFLVLKSSIEKLRTFHSTPSIIDLHSMPSQATEYHLKITPDQDKFRPDFCVSDIEGQSCSQEYIDHMCELLGFAQKVTQNKPYFGGHITRHIHAAFGKSNNIQVEINRSIYMDEEQKELIPEKVDKLKPRLTEAILKQFKRFIPS